MKNPKNLIAHIYGCFTVNFLKFNESFNIVIMENI